VNAVNATEVAIVGAGPYGLSLSAQLTSAGVPHRIFGRPMEVWADFMPAGMFLKSDGIASDLYDAEGTQTLKNFCQSRGLQYDDLTVPVSLENFVNYGLDFQAQKVPALEKHLVTSVERKDGLFELQLDNGEKLRAQRVVVASGISYLHYIPPEIEKLGPVLCTHTREHTGFAKFRGKRVAVVGRGASAIDTAALLHAAGAHCEVIARHAVNFGSGPGKGKRPLLDRMLHPHFGLGSSFRSSMYALFPHLFHFLPLKLRKRIVSRHLGPGVGYMLRPQVEGLVTIHVGYHIVEAKPLGDGVVLVCANAQGEKLEVACDHVIAGTGYRPAVKKVAYLSPELISAIELEEETPVLTSNFESSVPGLYFTGVLAAHSFGPLLRFALGARFTSATLASHLRRVVPVAQPGQQLPQSEAG